MDSVTKYIPDLSIIIVTYNTADLIAACLQSVMAASGVTTEIFVVDNDSADNSAQIVRSDFPDVRLLVNKNNLGYGKANNLAIRESAGRYIVLLNPDTTVETTAFRSMLEFMDSHPEIGLAGPKVVNPDGSRQDSVSYRYPGHRYAAASLPPLPGDIACVLGACQIVRADLMRQLSGFDEDFFLYGEDQDLCLRIRKHGFAVGFIDNALIMHHGGYSERNTLPTEVVRKKIRAEYLFYRKHYPAEVIRKIRSAHRIRANWQLLLLTMLKLAGVRRDTTELKIQRYRVIMEETRLSPKNNGEQ